MKKKSFLHIIVPRIAGNLSCCVTGVKVMEDAEAAHILHLSSMCCPYTVLHWKGNSTAKKRVGGVLTNPAHLLFATYISFSSKGFMNMMLSSNEVTTECVTAGINKMEGKGACLLCLPFLESLYSFSVNYVMNLGHSSNHHDISSLGISKDCFSATCFEKCIYESYIKLSCKGFCVHIFCQIKLLTKNNN